MAVEIARRYFATGDVDAVGDGLRAAAPEGSSMLAAPDFDWESACIDYLERSGDIGAAQASARSMSSEPEPLAAAAMDLILPLGCIF